MSIANYFTALLAEALEARSLHDPAQGVVAVRAAGVVYIGHVDFVADGDSAACLVCVDRDGRPAPYPIHISVAAIESMRYADLNESPHAHFAAGGGPI